MKDYLSTNERDCVMILGRMMDLTNSMIVNWEQRGNLTKEESKALKMVKSWGIKAWESIYQRQNESSKKAFMRAYKTCEVNIDMKSIMDVYKKKKYAECKMAYDENKEYMRMVELVMHYNCQGCNKECTKCEFYSEFEQQFIPEFTGAERYGKCKYSYFMGDDKGGNGERKVTPTNRK